MEWVKVRKVLSSAFSRDDDAAALSRRDMLAGLGLAGLFLAAPKLLSSAAEARTVAPDAGTADATDSKVTQRSDAEPKVQSKAAESGEVTEFSAHRRRYWHRHHWRRRRWRRRYWRRRYWRHPHWRRRHWRRRYWRRRYW